MTLTTSNSYLDRVRSIVADARTAKHAYSARSSKRDTIVDARSKTAEKLRENKAYLLDPVSAPKPDSVHKMQADGRYTVGIKYGNRYLEHAFDGEKYIVDVSAAELPALLEMFAVDVENCMFDEQIKLIMQANVAARKAN